MSFIKKYSILLIPAGIVVLAVAFIALTVLTNRSLAANIKKISVVADQQISNLVDDAVSADQWQAEKQRQDALQAEADAVVQLSQQCSMRELISYAPIFPKPTDKSQQVFDEYARRYREAIEQMIRGMNALEAPSEMEIRSEIGESAALTGTYNAAAAYSRNTPTMTPATRSQGDTARQAMIDAVCARRAEQIAVYANPTVFLWYEYWADWKFPGEDLAVSDCWHSQMAFWIYEDVAATINALNAGSANVYASPVKRLLGVTFTKEADYPQARIGDGYYGGARTARGDYGESAFGAMIRGDAPEYIRYPDGGQLDVAPWTARLCSDDVDVVHFSVGVITASSAVMPFMKELCHAKEHKWWPDFKGKENETPPQTGKHNQITILKSEVLPVDPLADENASYRYGDEAVVRLNLVCEYLFNRTGYDPIKPDKVKEYLGQKQIEGQTQTDAVGGAPTPPQSRTAAPAPTRAPRKPAREIGGDDF